MHDLVYLVLLVGLFWSVVARGVVGPPASRSRLHQRAHTPTLYLKSRRVRRSQSSRLDSFRVPTADTAPAGAHKLSATRYGSRGSTGGWSRAMNSKRRRTSQRAATGLRVTGLRAVTGRQRMTLSNGRKRFFASRTRLGRLSPEEFKHWYMREVMEDDDVNPWDSGEAPGHIKHQKEPDKLPSPTKPTFTPPARTTTTRPRVSDFYEPYWPGGNSVIDLISKMGEGLMKVSDMKLATLPFNANVKFDSQSEERFSALMTFRHCHPHCTTIYFDYGTLCAFRLASQDGHWRYMFETFHNICEMEYQNCAYYYWDWKIMHRGKCHEHTKAENTMDYTIRDVNPRMTFYPLPPIDEDVQLGQRAASWMTVSYKPIKFPV